MFPQKHKSTIFGLLIARLHYLLVLVGFCILGFATFLGNNSSQTALAATSSTLNFQGRLYQSNGAIVPDGYYNIQFKLYDGGTQGGPGGTGQANAGTNLWTESYYDSNGVTAGNDNRLRVVNGYFSANLGSQTAFGAINWDQELWLTMNVGGSTQTATPTYDGEMLASGNTRTKLTGVPYAFRAGAVTDSSGNAYTGDDLIQKAPGSVQSASSASSLIRVNQTGVGGLLQLQSGGSDAFTINNSGNVVAAGTGTFQGASLTVGTTSQSGSLILNDGSSNTATLSLAAFGQNTVITIPDPGAGTDTICLQGLNNCAGTGDIHQNGNSFGAAVTIGSNDGYGLNLETNNTTVASFSSSGAAIFKNASNSAAGFVIQRANGTSLLTANTGTGDVTITQGGLVVNGTDNPATPTLTSSGTGGTLSAGTYYYRLAATNSGRRTFEVKANPYSVTTAGSTSKNTLTWSAVTNADGYKIYRSIDGGTTWYVNTVSSATTSIVDDGTNYTWATAQALQAYNDTGNISITPDNYVNFGFNAANSPSIGYQSETNTLAIANYDTSGGIDLYANTFNLYDTTGYNQNLTITNTGATTFKNRTNSTTAFQIQDASGASVLNVETTATNHEVSVGSGSGFAGLAVNGGTSQVRDLYYRTAGSDRFILRVDNTAESGSNAGSNFLIRSYDDSGAYLGTPLTIFRNDGSISLRNTINSANGFNILQADGSTRLSVDTQDSQGLKVYGNSSDEIVEISNSAGLQVKTTGTTAWTNLGTDNASTNILNLYDNGNVSVGSVSGTGAVTFNNSTNSTTAFQIQNAAGSSLFTADSSNKKITTLDLNVGSPSSVGDWGRLFSDDFEGAVNDKWTGGTSTSGTSTALPSQTQKRNGKFSERINATGTGAAYLSTSISGATTTTMRGYIYISSQTNDYTLMELRNGGSAAELYLENTTGKIAAYNTANSTAYVSTNVPSTGAWHQVEMDVTYNATTGSITVYVDGTQVINQTNINTGTTLPNTFRLGESTVGRAADIYYDDVVVDSVRPGDSANLYVADSLHVAGTSSFGNSVLIQTSTNVANAFVVQDASRNNILTADTANNRVLIGTGATNVAGEKLTVQTTGTGYGFLQTNGTISLGSYIDGSAGQFGTYSNHPLDFFTGNGNYAQRIGTDGSVIFKNYTNSATGFQVQNAAGTGNNFIVDTQNNRVGINAAPSYALDVSSADNTQLRLQGSTAEAGIILNPVAGSASKILFQDGGTTKFEFGKSAGNAFNLYDNANGKDVFQATSSGVVLIQPVSGNVGIGAGATNPQALLHVSGAGGGSSLFRVSDTTATARDVLDIADGGATTFRNQTDSTTAFQIQNASGAPIFGVDTSYDSTNLITNGSFEANTTGWAAMGSATISRTTSPAYIGNASLQIATTAAANDGAKFQVNMTGGVTYSFAVNYRAGTAFSTPEMGYSEAGVSDVSCSSGTSITTTNWKRVTCSFTPTSPTNGSSYIYIKQTDATSRTFYVDAINLVAATNTSLYREAGITLNGVINSPLFLQNTVNSQTALSLKAASGSEVFNVNTIDTTVGIGTGVVTSAKLRVSNTANITTLDIQQGNASADVATFQSTNGSSVTVLKLASDGAATFKSKTNSATAFQIQNSSGVSQFTADSTNGGLTLGSTSGTGTITVGQSTASNTISIGSAIGASATQTINIGTSATATSVTTLTLGSLIGSSTTTIQSGTGNVNLQAAGTSTIGVIQVGAGGAGSTTPDYLALDVKSTTGDPAGGANGYMYYNTFDNKFRCYEAGTWKDCDTNTAGTVTLQSAYGNDADGGDSIIALTSADDSIIIRNPASGGTDSTYSLTIDQLSTGATGGLSIQSAGTGNLLLVTDTTATATDVLKIADGGAATFRNQTNSSGAFTVQNTAGASLLNVDSSGNNINLLTNNSGELQAWQTNANTLTTTMSDPDSVVVNGYIYTIGGNGTTTNYAKINGDGSVGTFATTTALPSSVRRNAVVYANGYIYTIGGYDGASVISTVYYSKVNTDGTLGTWQTGTSLPAARSYGGAVAYNGYIFFMGGSDGTSGVTSVYSIKTYANGSMASTWTDLSGSTPLLGARLGGAVTMANGYVYFIGGKTTEASTTGQTNVYYARINLNGTLTTFSNGTNTSFTGRHNARAGVANGYVYVFGGRASAADRDDVQYSALSTNGSNGSWTTATNLMPSARSGQASTFANGYFYELGGGGTNTVYYASTPRVKIAGSLDLVGSYGQTLADAGGAGSLTAGNTKVLGSLEVQGQGTFAQGLVVDKDLRVGGSAFFQNTADSTSAFIIQNSAGTSNLFVADTTNTRIGIGTSSPAYTLDVAGDINGQAIRDAIGWVQTAGGVEKLKNGINNGSFGGGSSISKQSLTSNDVSFFDSSTVNANSKSFASAIFDGRYIYFIPFYRATGATYHGQITRYDTTKDFSSTSSYTVFDTTAVNANSKGFLGASFDGRYIYLIPYATAAGTGSGQITRYDTQANFTSTSSYSVYDTTAVNANSKGFVGGVFDGRYLYLVPYYTGAAYSGQITRYDTTASFTAAGSYSVYDTTAVNASSKGFQGAVFDGRYIYYVPYATASTTASGLVTRYDTYGTFNSASSYSVYDMGNVSATAKGFDGGYFDGKYVYFIPHYNVSGSPTFHGNVARYDTSQSFTSSSSYTVLDTGAINSNSKGFVGGAFDGRYLYMAPYSINGANNGQITRIKTYSGGVDTVNSINKVATSAEFLMNSNGSINLQNNTNSQTAFRIQDTSSNNVLSVSTQDISVGINASAQTDSRLYINNSTNGYANLRLNTTSTTGNILELQKSSTAVFTVGNGGEVVSKNASNSTSAFMIQSTAGASGTIFDVDTSNGRIGINTGSSAPTADLTFGEGASARAVNVLTRTSNAAGTGLTVTAGAAGAGASAFTGGTLTLQGGAAGGTGNANGGTVSIAGGAGTGTGVQGLVNLSTTAFTSASTQTFAANGSLTTGLVDQYATIPVNATAASLTVTIPAPATGNQTVGRLLYIAAVNGSNDFTISLAGTSITIVMKANSTATLIWNGTGWTAAGASSSTDLQSAYNNTVSSAGGAELVLNAAGGAADGLTVRNNGTTPIIGGLLEVQSSTGSNLFAVNNNATEYATNGGSETAGGTSTTFPSNTWSQSATGGTQATISRTITSGEFATGVAAAKVVTTGATTANQGIANQIAVNGTNTALTANLTYTVAFTVKGTANFTTLDVVYSRDGTNTSTTSCTTGKTVTQTVWTRIGCTFTAPSSGITTSNAIFIRQSDSNSNARTFYIDNLSVTVSANTNHATDGSVDSALGTNWTTFGAGTAVTRDTTTLYDTSGSVKVDTTNNTDRGVTNNLTITPSTSTQYLVTFYAKLGSGTFTDIRVRYSRDGGTNFVSCADYNTQTLSTSVWTKITCLFTTDSTTATNADLIIDQPTAPGSTRTFYVDALSVTLNTNNANNVQIGGGSKGGPVTLFTLDRSAGAPIAANNDAYLGSMYYDTTTGRIQCYESAGWGTCGAPPDNIVNLNPEYAGAVLNGTGVGTMTADLCSNDTALSVNTSLCSTGQAKNFYKWTSPQATQQTYSIYVSYQLPSTFNGFSSDDTVQLVARVDSTTNASVTYQMFKSTGSAVTQCGSGETDVITGGGGSANTWYSYGINGNEATGCSFTSSSAGNYLLFKINLKANSNANAYVSTLSFTTTGR